jgi:hypothetical protein
MFPINPLSGALAQSTQIQISQASEKTRQARHAQDLEKNVAARDEEMEHQVENSEELTEIHEEGRHSDQGRKRNHHKPEEEESADIDSDGLDLTA